MSNLERWQQPAQLDRRTSKALAARQQNAALQDYDEQRSRLVTSIRNEGGAILSGELNFWLETLGQQQDRLEHESPRTAARVGHVLDQLAVNGAACIYVYMRDRS